MEKNDITDRGLPAIFEMFFGKQPEEYDIKETSRRRSRKLHGLRGQK